MHPLKSNFHRNITFLIALLCAGASLAAAPEAVPTVPSPADPLPDIEARNFDVAIVRHSRSGRIYLFDDTADAKTRPGKILLLRNDGEPVMAFRVMKTYRDKKQIAAKRVRMYRGIQELASGQAYNALEKVGDLPAPPPTAQDKADIQELEALPPTAPMPKETEPTPPTPTPTPTPEPEPSPEPTPEPSVQPTPEPSPEPTLEPLAEPTRAPSVDEDEEEPEPEFGVTADEITRYDHYDHWLSASVGYFVNNGVDLKSSAYFTGGGLRYAWNAKSMVFLKNMRAQDSVAIEGGMFLYKSLNFGTNGASYTVVPTLLTVRYNLHFNEDFAIFFYTGIMHNFAGGSGNGNAETAAALSSTRVAGGGGMFFRIGPNWFARADLGIDAITLGITLRF